MELTVEEKEMVQKMVRIIFDSDTIMESGVIDEEELNLMADLSDKMSS